MKLDAFGIGTVVEDLNGFYDKIKVNVRCPLSKGTDYLIVDKFSGEYVGIDVTERPPNVSGGDVEISITEQHINVSKGSLIIRDPANVELTYHYLFRKIRELEKEINT